MNLSTNLGDSTNFEATNASGILFIRVNFKLKLILISLKKYSRRLSRGRQPQWFGAGTGPGPLFRALYRAGWKHGWLGDNLDSERWKKISSLLKGHCCLDSEVNFKKGLRVQAFRAPARCSSSSSYPQPVRFNKKRWYFCIARSLDSKSSSENWIFSIWV